MPPRAFPGVTRILFGALALSLFFYGCDKGGAGAGAPERPLPEVSYVELEPETMLADDILPGRVSSIRVAEVRPQVGGIIQKRLFEEGELVKEGQALYQIDAAPFRADVEPTVERHTWA